MGRRSRILIIAGLLLAAAVGIAVYSVTNRTEPSAQATPTRPVVVALRDIPTRTLFTQTNIETLLTVRAMPVDIVPPQVLNDPTIVIGKATLTKVLAGEMLLDSAERLGVGTKALGAAAVIPPGMVAMSIPISESNSVAGAINPGDQVDIAAYLELGREIGGSTSVTILRGVEVLSVGPYSPQGEPTQGRTANTITFILDRQDALVLNYLVQSGARINLLLRRFDESQSDTTQPVTQEYLARRYGQTSIPR